nr:hypothetical protein BaRGS_017988 [Batillaria attramentaria]
MFIGRWHVAGRHDEGLVEDFRWNEECIVSMTLRTAPYPAWFNHPRGNHSLQIDSIGRDEMGVCRGVHYKWGELTEELPGFYKYKLVGAMHYSLLYVIATDYEDYAVLGVCESKINQEQLRFYCHTLTILLLLRQLPDNGYAVE